MATIKQKKAFDKTLENMGNVSKSMRQVGYSASVAKNPKILTDSKGWKELTEEYLSDELLAERHLELLNKREVIRTPDGDEVSDQPDTQAVKAALDMAYKIKDKYAAEKHISLTYNLSEEHKNKATNAIRQLFSGGNPQ
jgi:hypothetical protein